jgi:hypothetical protein
MSEKKNGFKKIVSKNGSFMSGEPNGQLWISHDNGKSFSMVGTIYNGHCNIHKLQSLPDKYNDYFPVYLKLLRFADRFKIKKLRLIRITQKLVEAGWTAETKYGYVDKKKFEYLMKNRKNKQMGENVVVLLKEKDAEWKEQ